MTATKLKKTNLIKDEEIFATMIADSMKLAENIKDLEAQEKSINEKIFLLMQEKSLPLVHVQGIGTAEIVTKGGSLSWDQKLLINELREQTSERELDLGETIIDVCKLTPRAKDAQRLELQIDSARKFSKTYEELEIR